MEISDSEFEAASRRGAEKKASFPPAIAVHFDHRISRVVISLASGLDIAFVPSDVQGLENATPGDLTDARISPSGFGVHFPKLDADIYIPALMEGYLGTKRWMAAQNGSAGGGVSSEAKRVAAGENGKRGGRPRKSAGADEIPEAHKEAGKQAGK